MTRGLSVVNGRMWQMLWETLCRKRCLGNVSQNRIELFQEGAATSLADTLSQAPYGRLAELCGGDEWDEGSGLRDDEQFGICSAIIGNAALPVQRQDKTSTGAIAGSATTMAAAAVTGRHPSRPGSATFGRLSGAGVGGVIQEGALVLTNGRSVLLLGYDAPPLPPLLLVDTALSPRPGMQSASQAQASGGCASSAEAAAMTMARGAVTSSAEGGSGVRTGSSGVSGVLLTAGSGWMSSNEVPDGLLRPISTRRPVPGALSGADLLGGGGGGSARLSSSLRLPSSATSLRAGAASAVSFCSSSHLHKQSLQLLTMPPTPLAATLVSQRLFSPERLLRQESTSALGLTSGEGSATG